MKKITKYKKIILLIMVFPLLLLFINRMLAFYYDKTYFDLDKGITAGKYEIKKINIEGNVEYNSSNKYFVGKYDSDGILELLDNSKEYNGHLFLDTLNLNFIIDIDEHISGSEMNDNYVHQENYATIDKKGKIVKRIEIDSINYRLKNCVLLKNKIGNPQDWDDKSDFIFMKHFLKTGFRPCFIPSMSLGLSHVNTSCKTWEGIAYFDLISKREKFRFKFPGELSNLFFVDSFDFFLGYYEVPKKYQERLDVCFFVNRNDIYIIKRK